MAETKARKLPPGYDSEDAFIKDARERFQMGLDADRENRDEGTIDLKFLALDQWDPADVKARAGRPCLTVDQIGSFVSQVTNDIRVKPPGIKVSPGEGADKDLADTREGLIRAIERQNRAKSVYVSAAENQVGCGIGNFRVGLKYANDGFNRDIEISNIPNAFAVVWDPYAVEPTGKDAEDVFVVDEMRRKVFEKKHKDAQASDLTIPTVDSQGWYAKDSVRVCEYWKMVAAEVEICLLEDGTILDKDKLPPGTPVKATRKIERKSAWMYLITGQEILDGPYILPIKRVPIFRVEGWIVNVGDKRVRGGLVRRARDAQRLKNFWRSVAAETIGLAPKENWLVHESEEGDQDTFRDAHASGDTILPWSGQVKPERIAPPPIPAALLQQAEINVQDMKDATGLHDASLGARSNETSGKAIQARQREGDVATFNYPYNLNCAVEELGTVVNDLIPVVFDTARTIRVVGKDETAKVVRINDPNDPHSVDINQGEFDLAVESGPSYSTQRVESADAMMNLFQTIPAAAAAAPDLIAKAMDFPDAEVLAERLKRTVPPQLLEGEEGQEPKQPSPAEQQAMQMQEQMAGIELQKAQAEVAKAQADARRAEAEADKAEAEAGRSHFDLGHTIGAAEAAPETFAPQSPAADPGAMGEAPLAA